MTSLVHLPTKAQRIDHLEGAGGGHSAIGSNPRGLEALGSRAALTEDAPSGRITTC